MTLQIKHGAVSLDVPFSADPYRGCVLLEVADKDAAALKSEIALSPLEARVLADALLRFAADAERS